MRAVQARATQFPLATWSEALAYYPLSLFFLSISLSILRLLDTQPLGEGTHHFWCTHTEASRQRSNWLLSAHPVFALTVFCACIYPSSYIEEERWERGLGVGPAVEAIGDVFKTRGNWIQFKSNTRGARPEKGDDGDDDRDALQGGTRRKQRGGGRRTLEIEFPIDAVPYSRSWMTKQLLLSIAAYSRSKRDLFFFSFSLPLVSLSPQLARHLDFKAPQYFLSVVLLSPFSVCSGWKIRPDWLDYGTKWNMDRR